MIILPRADEPHASLTVLYLFWQVSCSTIDDFLLTFNCLLNIGSHLVIIHEDLVDKLKLCCKRLWKPIFTETAMHNGQKNIIELDEVGKLQLCNPSGHYVSKSVCAVISPSICIPIL